MISKTGNVVNEGCSGISKLLMEEIYIDYCDKKNIADVGRVPSCVQFRLGTAKGMAYIDPALKGRCIELTEKQRKYTCTEPTYNQCKFEVNSFFNNPVSKPMQSNGELNRALEPRLARPGVLI